MFESLFLYTGSNSRAGKTLKYELTYLFLRGLWLKQITECSFQEKWAIIYRHRGDTWTSTIYRRMNRDTRFTASRHMCRYIAIQPHVVSSKVSRYLGRDTIRVSRSHVSRCIDASMHRYTPSSNPPRPPMDCSLAVPLCHLTPVSTRWHSLQSKL